MSNFLAPYFELIPAAYLILQTQNALVGHLTANGWQLLGQSDGNWSDVIPPATETIGTATFREVVRIYFPSNTTISIGSYQACIANAFAQSIRLTALTGGAVQAGVTINGVTVLGAAGGAGATANDNLRSLFYALRDSVDVTITGWDHWYNGSDTLISTNKTKAANVTCSGNANVTYSALGSSVLTGAQSDYARVSSGFAYPVTTDLTNGFIWYVSVNARSFTLGTRCNSGKYGGIFASYIDHAEALAATPAGGFCTPIELMVGAFDELSGKGYAKATHWWGIPTRYFTRAITNTGTTATYANNDFGGEMHPFTGASLLQIVSDVGATWCEYPTNYAGPDPITLFELSVGDTQSLSTSLGTAQYKVVPLGSLGAVYQGASAYHTRFVSSFNLPDINKWNGTEPDETSAAATYVPLPGINGVGLTLQQALDATTAYTTFTLSGTTGLSATGGSFLIDSERFTYTGLSGSSPIGIARSQEGTVMARHFIGEPVQPLVWFLKLNNSAIACGNAKPA